MDPVPHAFGPKVILHGRLPEREVGSGEEGDIGRRGIRQIGHGELSFGGWQIKRDL